LHLMDFIVQAEDSIRVRNVTGVQTCALPISDIYFSSAILGLIDHDIALIIFGDKILFVNHCHLLMSIIKNDIVFFAKRRKFPLQDRKSTRLNTSHVSISYAVVCLNKKRTLYR